MKEKIKKIFSKRNIEIIVIILLLVLILLSLNKQEIKERWQCYQGRQIAQKMLKSGKTPFIQGWLVAQCEKYGIELVD